MSTPSKRWRRIGQCLMALLSMLAGVMAVHAFILAVPVLLPLGLIWAAFFRPAITARRRRQELLRIHRIVEMHLIAHRLPNTRSNREVLFQMFGGSRERRAVR